MWGKSKMSGMGAPKKLSEAELLQAIKDFQTVKVGELIKGLKKRGVNVHRATIYRTLDKIPAEAKERALGKIVEEGLKPAEAEKAIFLQLPTMKEFRVTLKDKRGASIKYVESCENDIYRISKLLNKNPDAITPNDISELLINVKKGTPPIDEKGNKMFGGGYGLRKSARAWFNYKNFPMGALTNLGIHSKPTAPRDPSRNRAHLTREHRRRIREEAHKLFNSDFEKKIGSGKIIKYPFKSEPNLALALDEWFEFKYYTGTRKEATLQCRWQITDPMTEGYWGVEFQDKDGGLTDAEKCEMVVIRVTDKGKHEKGRKKWDKKLIGKAKDNFVNFYIQLGKPKTGLLFPFKENEMRYLLIEIYKAADIPEQLYKGMPDHIWRHTAAQDLLDATEWNRPIVAAVLGWESEDILKKSYGEMPPTAQLQALRKASGLPITVEKKEFIF